MAKARAEAALAGATVLANPEGTAPGFAVRIGTARCFCMPGVPREMKRMFEHEVLPQLPPPAQPVVALRLKTFGLTESEVNDRLEGLEEKYAVVLGYRASFPEVEVKILARGADREQVAGHVRSVADAVRAHLGQQFVYGEGRTTLAAAVGELLAERGLRLGLAESCTGGLVSSLITEVAGSSRYFVGGVVSYDNAVKCGVLGVGADTLGDQGAVSEAVARQMAVGARRTPSPSSGNRPRCSSSGAAGHAPVRTGSARTAKDHRGRCPSWRRRPRHCA